MKTKKTQRKKRKKKKKRRKERRKEKKEKKREKKKEEKTRVFKKEKIKILVHFKEGGLNESGAVGAALSCVFASR